MNTLRITCSECWKSWNVDKSFIGKTWKCPNCGNKVLIQEETNITIHEQTIESNIKENQSLFSKDNFTKFFGIVFIWAIAFWNIHSYLYSLKVNKFIEKYNEHVLVIQQKSLSVEESHKKIENILWNFSLQTSKEELKQKEKELDNIKTKTMQNFEDIKKHSLKIQTDACPILKHSQNECIDFSQAMYDLAVFTNNMLSSRKEWTNDTQENELIHQVESRKAAFKIAVRKDGVEL